jgi:hypothetical protein
MRAVSWPPAVRLLEASFELILFSRACFQLRRMAAQAS